MQPNQNDMNELLFRLLENDISDEDFAKLKDLLESNMDIRRYYCQFMADYTALLLRPMTTIQEQQKTLHNELLSDNFWQTMSAEEKNAPAVVLPEKKPRQEIIQKVEYPKSVRIINKPFLISTFTSIAALFILIAYLQFSPQFVTVAIVKDCMNIQFADNKQITAGDRLTNRRDSYWLKSGILEIEFDFGAKVVIEAPAEFKLDTEEKMTLNSGRLYAKVPGSAIGFMVDTPTSRVIDLGTEFGVKVDVDGNSDVHMFKGKASLIPGRKGKSLDSQMLTIGYAKRINADGQFKDIPLEDKKFARAISSQSGLVWRGQPEVSLASIVSGGDGFNQGNILEGIDASTGRVSPKQEIRNIMQVKANFLPVPERPFIDGVFVPDGRVGKQTVTSSGLVFDGFPATTSQYYADISANPRFNIEGYPTLPLYLADTASDSGKPDSYLSMHTNAGITFDLEKIRFSLGQVELVSFKALCGVSENMENKTESEFWVLLDGQLVCHHKVEKGNPVAKWIDIPLQPGQRFLTLATTEGQDEKMYDCCLFKNPRLELKQK